MGEAAQPVFMADYDLAIVGGGINGAGIARDAAGRGLRVLLVEQHDLASGTSSASTKLIHGGLRYLEHRAFRLVREALAEREVLLGIAPHIIRPLRFVLPAYPGPRSALLLRFGLFLYDRLGGRKLLPATRTLNLRKDPAGAPLQPRYRYGFEYSDAQVDDSRLVVLNAVDAAARGAVIRTRTRLTGAERGPEWRLRLDASGARETATARMLINAAGPWAGVVLQKILSVPGRPPLRLVKGSHIVVRKLFDHGRGYIFQNPDHRIVFALPFGDDHTLIGTTDEDFKGNLDVVTPEPDEIDYLCGSVNRYFRTRVAPEQVVWSFAGVRSLYDDGAGRPEDVTRDYHLVIDEASGRAPLLTIYGGKITTYRRLAEAALESLSHIVPMRPAWTAHAPLPGGNIPWDSIESCVDEACGTWPFLNRAEAHRLVRAYGTRLPRILGVSKSRDELAPWFGPLSAAEVRYLMSQEWTRSPEDLLWRRSKLGLVLSVPERDALAAFMTAQRT